MLKTEHIDMFNAIFEWGKIHLLSPTTEPYLEEIEGFCKPYFASENLERLLSDSIDDTKQQVNSAMETFSNPDLIMATEDDDIWYEAQESFIAFDSVIYLTEANYYLVSAHEKSLSEKVMTQLSEVLSGILSWFEDGDFSPLRLSVLNDSRRSYLARIPEDKRYLFPWYESFSDYDENILNVVSENLNVFSSDYKDGHIPEQLKSHVKEIKYELNRDKILFSKIQEHFVLHNSLMRTFSKRSALTLWRLGDKSSLEKVLPPHVVEAGPVRISRSLLEEAAKFSYTETDKAYWAFMLAFCGPGLEDKERLKLLDKAEKMVKNIDLNDIADDKAGVLRTLKIWFEERCENSDLVEASFDAWIKLMEEKAEGLPVMEFDEEPVKLSEALNTLLSKSIEDRRVYEQAYSEPEQEIKEPSVSILDTIFGWIERIISTQTKLQAAPAMMLDKEIKKVEEDIFELKEEKKSICLALKSNAKGEYFFLADPKEVFSFHSEQDEKDYRELWDFMKKRTATKKYWGGCFITMNGESIKIKSDQIDGTFLDKTKSDNYKHAIIGISNEKDDLDKFVQLLDTFGKVHDLKEDKPLKVVALIISFAKDSSRTSP